MSVLKVARPILRQQRLFARCEPILSKARGTEQNSEDFVRFDVTKTRHAVADNGRTGEVRYLGEIDSDPAAVRRMVAQRCGRHRALAGRGKKLNVTVSAMA